MVWYGLVRFGKGGGIVDRPMHHFIDLNLSSDVIIEKDKRGEYFIVYSQDIIDSIDA